MVKLTITTIGSSAGIILPEDMLVRLRMAKGDTVFLTESPDGFRITSYEPELEEQMTHAHKFMRQRQDALRELAK